MNIIKLELTEQEAKIYDEVMEQIEKTATFLAGLSHEERLDWLKEHQYTPFPAWLLSTGKARTRSAPQSMSWKRRGTSSAARPPTRAASSAPTSM